MSLRGRALILATLIAILVGPIVTAHPALSHLWTLPAKEFAGEVRHASVLVLLLLVGVSALPLVGALGMLARWLSARKTMATIAGGSKVRRTADGIGYRLAPVPGVSFFTLGVFRPTIFASESAHQHLSGEAFRAAILHEREHVRRRDPAWRFALAMVEAALGPIPHVRQAVSALALDCEFGADRGAVAAGASPEHLFDAMVAAAGPIPVNSAGLTSVGVVERLEALAAPSAVTRPGGAPGLAWVTLGLVTVPAIAHGLFWIGAVCL